MRRPLAALSLLGVVILLSGCPDDEEPDLCGPDAEKQAAADLLYDWYLYLDALPPAVDTTQYATTAELLDAMTAEAQSLGQDRGWTYVTTRTAAQTFFEEGTAVGFGVGLLAREGSRLFVSQVYPGSAAADAGLQRGDEILRIGETEATLAPVGPAIADGTLGALIGPAEAGVTRVFEVAGAAGLRTITKRSFGLDPVPLTDSGQRWKIIPRDGKPPAGYVALRTFISNAEATLSQAFQEFEDAGVTDVVVDLRYNGGGLVVTAELLANLLGGGLPASTIMSRVENNALHTTTNQIIPFSLETATIAATRIAFITTGASASASELVPNVLEPHRQVAIVGSKTYGKPVGQRGFSLRGCETVVYLVSFRLANSQGDGGYYDGLPDAAGAFGGPLCDAPDDLAHPQWDPLEASTQAALHWLDNGSCPGAPAAHKLSALSAKAPDTYPAAPEPSLAQRHVSGLF